MHTNIALRMAKALGSATPNIRHSGRRDMKKCRAQFTRWLCKVPDHVTLQLR